MVKIKIWEWLEKQEYQTDYDETGEYKMYYASDMPKILNAFCEYQKTVGGGIMIREIMFRAKKIFNGTIGSDKWIYSFNIRKTKCGDTFNLYLNGEQCIWDTLEQYTNSKDKNDKEIYEGNIVHMQYQLNKEEANGIVKMIDGCWMLDFQHLPQHKRPYDPHQQITRRFDYLKMFTMSMQKTAEIVGDIHEEY